MELNRLGLQESNRVMKGERFTGWFWEVAGLVKKKGERENGRKREKEKGREEEREEERFG